MRRLARRTRLLGIDEKADVTLSLMQDDIARPVDQQRRVERFGIALLKTCRDDRKAMVPRGQTKPLHIGTVQRNRAIEPRLSRD
jgi:hypothetical protein